MPLDLTNKCYVMGIPRRCGNEICEPEITWKEGEAGKKGVSDQNVENISHVEVIMIPQKSECNLDGSVEGGWQSTCVCVGGNFRHVDNIFSRLSVQGQMSPEVLSGRKKCSEDVLFTFPTALHNGLLYCYKMQAKCHHQFWNIFFLMISGSQSKDT